MNLLHKLGLMTINDHNNRFRAEVDKVNAHMASEIGRYNMQVDETISAITKWRFDSSELLTDHGDIRVTLEIPRSLLFGMARSEPDISGFAVVRVVHILQGHLQRAFNQLIQPSGGEDTVSYT